MDGRSSACAAGARGSSWTRLRGCAGWGGWSEPSRERPVQASARGRARREEAERLAERGIRQLILLEGEDPRGERVLEVTLREQELGTLRLRGPPGVGERHHPQEELRLAERAPALLGVGE